MTATFFLGTHRPHWLERSPVPLCVSLVTLGKYRRDFPAGTGQPWILDSGGFSALSGDGWGDPDVFGGSVYRVIDGVGQPPRFVACQDWMCEEKIRARRGFTVEDHQRFTIESLLHLRVAFPHAPWAPVLQGQSPGDYLAHVASWSAAGVDLAAEPIVGVGSVCRLQSSARIEAVIRPLARLGLRLHGFGMKLSGLARVGHLLVSADSMAWSATARWERIRLDECSHRGVCNNCRVWAMRWRDRVLRVLDAPYLPELDYGGLA